MLSIDYLVIQDFTKEFMNKEPEEFFYDYVIDILNTKVMIVGYDFVFGFCNKGDISLLKQLCKENKIELIVIPPVKVNDTIVSSTLIRKLILKGELDEVKNMLGRPFSIYSPVVRGKQIGSTIGFPTANMQIDGNQALPPEGVYATTVNIEDKIYLSVSNLGKTNIRAEDISLETFIIDFKGNLYNKSIIINFHKNKKYTKI